MGVRILLVNDDDSIRRFPVSLFDRLNAGDPSVAFLEFAGKRVRYVLAVVDTQHRKVTDVRGLEYGFLQFDKFGRLDQEARLREGRMAMDMLADPFPTTKSTSVRDATHLFARRAFKHRYKWEPSETILRKIFEMLLRQQARIGMEFMQ